MAKTDNQTPAEPTPDYEKMTLEEVQSAIGKAWEAKDMKLMGQLSRLYAKKELEAEKAKREALLAELVKTTSEVRQKFTRLAKELVDSSVLDGAEGIWFAYDFGAVEELGINPSLRLVKTSRSMSGASAGGVTSKSSYVANPAKSADLLAKVGDHVYFSENTEVTIDKQTHDMPAGMTFKEAYDYSTNGGWRNRVRMALLKEAGII